MSEKFKVGDDVSNVKLAAPISLVGMTEQHIQAGKHKCKMTVHDDGVLLDHRGETWLLYKAGIVGAKLADKKEPAAKVTK